MILVTMVAGCLHMSAAWQQKKAKGNHGGAEQMVKRLGGIYVPLGLLLILLIMDIGLAMWLLTPPLTRRHIV